MPEAKEFRSAVRKELDEAVRACAAGLRANDGDRILRIDPHCHDRNSDVPDETLGRILRVPETWLPTADLFRTLRSNGADVLTVSNHNNARSCWEALDRGEDVLPGAEFSCTLPDFNVGVHVLTFGFTPDQEIKLNRLRKDIYKFLEYAGDEDIPTILAHPLNFYSPKGLPPLELMDRFAVLFERFEAVNGQRDAWQNLLTLRWIEGLDQEAIEAAAKRTGIRPETFCRRPYVKQGTGGSDCHFGIFPGSTGTLLRVPEGRHGKGARGSDLALEALRSGRIAPYGSHCEEEKLTIAFLDYFCQVALRMEDPGLLRLLLHRGTPGEKILAMGVANGLFELRRHKYTSRFLELFHQCLQGRRPGLLTSLFTSKAYQPMLAQLDLIAQARAQSPAALVQVLRDALPDMFRHLNVLVAGRVMDKIRKTEEDARRRGEGPMRLDTSEIIERIELPIHLRALFGQEAASGSARRPAPRSHRAPAPIDLGKWSDGLPFPALAAFVLGGASFAASHVLYGKRPFVNAFAERLGRNPHPHRALWLTDTLTDRNGVSHVLRSSLAEARRRRLPVDFLACLPGDAAGAQAAARLSEGGGEGGSHLHLIPSVAEFTLPFYQDQVIRMPDLMALRKVFVEGGYDRVMCSTEAPMGLFALYLKHAFNVPAYFYVHSDWLDFARRSLNFDKRQLDRLRRILRAFYRRFDGVFLLNNEQRDYFASPDMGLDPEKLFLTGHWSDTDFHPRAPSKTAIFPGLESDEPVLLYAGRLADEKGVMDLPEVYRAVKARVPRARIAIAGTGPASGKLKAALPDGIFLGWLDARRLADAYSSADLLLLPSWFDTFSCALLEALGCGLPAVAYDTKGPRDILGGIDRGLLAQNPAEMADIAAALLVDRARLAALKPQAKRRASEYQAEPIMNRLLENLGLGGAGKPCLNFNPEAKQADTGIEEEDGVFIDKFLTLMGA